MTQEMTTRKSWERLPEETPKAYAAFSLYLQMPPYGEPGERRSIANVAAKLGLSATSGVELWSAKYNWGERTAAYDSYRTNSAITVKETALAEFQQNIVIVMGQQLAVVNEILDRAFNEVRTKQQAGEPTDANEVKKLIDAWEKKDNMARRLAGMPTQYTTERALPEEDEEKVYVIGGA